jgi:hypothetical protein
LQPAKARSISGVTKAENHSENARSLFKQTEAPQTSAVTNFKERLDWLATKFAMTFVSTAMRGWFHEYVFKIKTIGAIFCMKFHRTSQV